MLESRLEATNNRAACLEDSNRELGVWKERLEQELGENERALQEKAKIHSEVGSLVTEFSKAYACTSVEFQNIIFPEISVSIL